MVCEIFDRFILKPIDKVFERDRRNFRGQGFQKPLKEQTPFF
jgi:hypothetical protein